jgi:hypothetical protein
MIAAAMAAVVHAPARRRAFRRTAVRGDAGWTVSGAGAVGRSAIGSAGLGRACGEAASARRRRATTRVVAMAPNTHPAAIAAAAQVRHLIP